jgi:hypothetical protein
LEIVTIFAKKSNNNSKDLFRHILYILDVNLFQLPPIGNLNASTNFYRLKGATACPIGTRAIEIEIKFTLDAVCYNINLYIEHARTPENEYDETFEDI